jgi:hypothetical protein
MSPRDRVTQVWLSYQLRRKLHPAQGERPIAHNLAWRWAESAGLAAAVDLGYCSRSPDYGRFDQALLRG